MAIHFCLVKERRQKSRSDYSIDNKCLSFPTGGTIRIYGLKEKLNSTFTTLLETTVYLTYVIYLETQLTRDFQIPLSHVSPPLLLPPVKPVINSGFFYWIKRLTSSSPAAITTADSTGQTIKKQSSFKSSPKNQLQEKISHALISTSAGCQFSLPSFLDRTTKEHAERTLETRRRSSFLSWKPSPKEEDNVYLYYFLLDTTSITSFIKHQSLIVTYTCQYLDQVCLEPSLREFRYFETDRSLGDTLDDWFHAQECVCGHLMSDHVHFFAHGNQKITIHFKRDPIFSKVWMSWSKEEERVEMSDSLDISFGKYLELVFYHPAFQTERCFHRDGLTLRFSREPGECFSLRLPRLQVHDAEVVYAAEEPRLSARMLNVWKRELDTKDLGLFFNAVLAHIDGLEHCRQTMLLRTCVEKEQREMQKALRETKLNELNDFRRHFSVRSQFVLGRLIDWQKEHCKKLMECTWEQPDYIRQDNVHCFPGSAVLVRENEPTSIIAYTLSSNEYIHELIQEEKTEKADTQAPNMAFLSTCSEKHSVPTDQQIAGGYYSSIERKYVSPLSNVESSSLRTMIVEVCRSNEERLEDLKSFLSWNKKPQVTGTVDPQTKELKVTSMIYDKSYGSPHIQHKFVHNGTEFTCIVYYANEFEVLRRQYGIHQTMIESLCRCQPWAATGGKSKSHFYKTQDDRFVVKEMMNVWNVSEKDAFLKFAPNYFAHLKKSKQTPSVLAKIFGFFTIQIRNAQKLSFDLDVVVMEHLFYGQHIIQKFDFKGIHDRQVDESRKQQVDVTLWDKDWLDDYKKKLLLQQKPLLDDAILSDTDFLSTCNIMDYSLLVGVNQETHEITIGIVDFIGAYTWYKKMESKGKSTLSKREVTVIPPEQYKSRFCKEICNYFIPVFGKFDKYNNKAYKAL
ncbi:unnamed protein product [Rhizopus stolonifer]